MYTLMQILTPVSNSSREEKKRERKKRRSLYSTIEREREREREREIGKKDQVTHQRRYCHLISRSCKFHFGVSFFALLVSVCVRVRVRLCLCVAKNLPNRIAFNVHTAFRNLQRGALKPRVGVASGSLVFENRGRGGISCWGGGAILGQGKRSER